MSSYYTGSNHDMYRLPGPFSSRPRHNTESSLLKSQHPMNSNSHEGRISSTPQIFPQSASKISNAPAESDAGHELHSKRSWSWCASSDFTYFPPFEQAHHRRSADTIRSSHADHWHTQAVWSPRGGTPDGLTPLPTPMGEADSSRSVFDSEWSRGEGSAEPVGRSWWIRVWKGARSWFGEKRG